MTPEMKELLDHVLALPAEARAALASQLLESLDEEVDANAEALWAEEIKRRVDDLDAGRVKTVPWEEVRQRLARGLDGANR